MRLKNLELTEAILARMKIIEICEQHESGGGYGLSPSQVDYVRLEFAEEVLAEIARQTMRRVDRIDRIDETIERVPVAVVDVELRRKRKHRA